VLDFDVSSGRIWDTGSLLEFADRPSAYGLTVRLADGTTRRETLVGRVVDHRGDETVVTGRFEESGVVLTQRLVRRDDGIDETVSLANAGGSPVAFDDIGIGWSTSLASRGDWRLVAIPFRVQLDVSTHDYSGADLVAGDYHNAVYSDPTRVDVRLTEDTRLRSEAWHWSRGDRGLVVIKYNNRDIELSVAAPFVHEAEPALRFGGCASALYGEPSRGHRLAAGDEFTFGCTSYRLTDGTVEHAYRLYRDSVDARGHGFPADYDPPVTWNELYDVGWFHSAEDDLARNYTRANLLREAGKARDVGCELLYLDPGWEVAEGTSLWDEDRLGTTDSFAKVLRDEYELELGFRTVLRCYRDHWPPEYSVLREGEARRPVVWNERQYFWELCLCNPRFRALKLDRLSAIVRRDVRFLMVDEMDWRGPCVDEEHEHAVPSTASDHVDAVYAMCRELRRRHPQLLIECHDPVWPWSTAIYVPTYYGQGFGGEGSYHENWGFEYMWDCIHDLKSGKALALYYYKLGSNVPLYLHITMAADNDECLFFWWAASTVRHLGIGGKHGHPTVNPRDLPAFDPEARYAAYRASMAVYLALKPYFVRGTFHGLGERTHLHTLPGVSGGVLVVFNLDDSPAVVRVPVPVELLGLSGEPRVAGATAELVAGELLVAVRLAGNAPAVVAIGDAAEAVAATDLPQARRG